ncbi:uncharacterized protein BKA78DRAFT_304790 [Phyllosticta capitalensis]|uniref:uncharacterized protein n=1 Tax=Phyllosticta capitalensis TaxID=121624 RepID=UPI003130D661
MDALHCKQKQARAKRHVKDGGRGMRDGKIGRNGRIEEMGKHGSMEKPTIGRVRANFAFAVCMLIRNGACVDGVKVRRDGIW